MSHLVTDAVTSDESEIYFATWIPEYNNIPRHVTSIFRLNTGNCSIQIRIEPHQLHALKAVIEQQLDNICIKTKELEALQANAGQEVAP